MFSVVGEIDDMFKKQTQLFTVRVRLWLLWMVAYFTV